MLAPQNRNQNDRDGPQVRLPSPVPSVGVFVTRDRPVSSCFREPDLANPAGRPPEGTASGWRREEGPVGRFRPHGARPQGISASGRSPRVRKRREPPSLPTVPPRPGREAWLLLTPPVTSPFLEKRGIGVRATQTTSGSGTGPRELKDSGPTLEKSLGSPHGLKNRWHRTFVCLSTTQIQGLKET